MSSSPLFHPSVEFQQVATHTPWAMFMKQTVKSAETTAEEPFKAMVDVQSARLPGLALLDKLPIELWERIFEFVGEIEQISDRERVSFPGDETAYPLIEPPKVTEPTPYDNLRSSSLAFRKFRAPAQRALFRCSRTHSSVGLLRLLRSLMVYPHNRKYVQWLLACRMPGENIYGRPNPPNFLDPLQRSVQVLGPLVQTPVMDQLHNASFFRRLLLPYLQVGTSLDEPENLPPRSETRKFLPLFGIIGDQILRAIAQLCPQIRGAHLFFFNTWANLGSRNSVPEAFQSLPNNMNGLLLWQECSRFKCLTLDLPSLNWLFLSWLHEIPEYPVGCPPTVEYLTVHGKNVGVSGPSETPIDTFSEWLSTNRRLREIRMLNGTDRHHRGWAKGPGNYYIPCNWNTILPMFSDTLEVLVIEGNKYWEGLGSYEVRFGEAGYLDCLPQLKKLRYLKAPLHYLRYCLAGYRRPEIDWDEWNALMMEDDGSLDMSDVVDEPPTSMVGGDDDDGLDDNEQHEQGNEQGVEDEQDLEDLPPAWARGEMGKIRLLRPGDEKNIRDLIEAEFPPSLKSLDVIFPQTCPYTEDEDGYVWRTIRVPL
ncbi:hypothetical protein B0T20DRAFT_491274 [Sordaria brevicollis]|uniref:Uncharacterized protein n=1 Tax=Sordaria brevicollis TaxID=83679 RepID=A0AAE0NV77_SORBR|nr:hypothetical protein B0T20DRAFT_491274 [Sordaria brevicollis]